MQPELIHALLAVLPEGLRNIELATHCVGPVLASLARFKRCRSLSISGNGAFMSWQGRGAAAVVPKLKHLRLDCREPNLYSEPDRKTVEQEYDADEPEPDDGDEHYSYLDGCIPGALAAATALTSLELVADWSDGVAALGQGLPALRSFRWVHTIEVDGRHVVGDVWLAATGE